MLDKNVLWRRVIGIFFLRQHIVAVCLGSISLHLLQFYGSSLTQGYDGAGNAQLAGGRTLVFAPARAGAVSFVRWYNVDPRQSGIRYVSPAQRHAGEDVAILAARRRVRIGA